MAKNPKVGSMDSMVERTEVGAAIERLIAIASQQPAPASTPGLTRAFYTIADLMERWRVSRATIYREIERGRLKRTLIAGSVRFAAENVATYEKRKL